MRGKILLALLLVSGCAKPTTPGVERLAGSSDAQGFYWSGQSRRLAYVEGRFPNRTYFAVFDRASGVRTRHRLKGYVLGRSLALSRDGRRALLEAGKIGRFDSRSEPVERVLLLIEAETGRIVSELTIGRSDVSVIGHPLWSPDPVAVWNTKDGLNWGVFGAEKTGGLLLGPASWRALLFDEPYLVAAEKQTSRPRMTVYDLRSGAEVAEWRVSLTGLPLSLRPDGTALTARWMAESGRFVLESDDPKTGRRVPVLETDGEIESAVETDAGLYVVAKDPTRRNVTGKAFLGPRVLLVVEQGGRRWSTPWTARPGSFLGSDPGDGRLLFAVTDRDRPAVWAISPAPSALAAAGRVIDER